MERRILLLTEWKKDALELFEALEGFVIAAGINMVSALWPSSAFILLLA